MKLRQKIGVGITALSLLFNYNSQAQTPSTNSLAHVRLDIEKRLIDKEKRPSEKEYSILNSLLEKADNTLDKSEVKTPDEAIRKLQEIHNLLYNEGFRYQSQDFLGKGLSTRKIDCDLYSLIYHSIGERKGYPIKLINVVPKEDVAGHMIIEWEFKDGKNIYWETTKGISLNERKEMIDILNYNCKKMGISEVTEENLETISSNSEYINATLANNKNQKTNLTNLEDIKLSYPEYARELISLYQRQLEQNPENKQVQSKLEVLTKQ